jgi:DNA-binding response OmpR family regulator
MKEKYFVPPPAPEIRLLVDEPQAFKRVLLMDDQPETASRVKQFLESRHFDVCVVRSAVNALREIIDHDYDVIICDMIKPNFSGETFHLAVSRVKPQLCRRFIFITGRNTPPSTYEFIKRINGLMLWRPFEMHVLLETVHLALQKAVPKTKTQPTTSVLQRRSPTRPEVSMAKVNQENMRLLHLCLAASSRSLSVISSQFVSDEATLRLLIAAAERGVRLEVFVPERPGGTAQPLGLPLNWAELARAGAAVYATRAALEAGRVFVCDERWTCFAQSNVHSGGLTIFHEDFTRRYLQTVHNFRTAAQRIASLESAPVNPVEVSVAPAVSRPIFSRLRGFFAGLALN